MERGFWSKSGLVYNGALLDAIDIAGYHTNKLELELWYRGGTDICNLRVIWLGPIFYEVWIKI